MTVCPVDGSTSCAYCKRLANADEKLRTEIALHKRLDAMAGKCGERTVANESHADCAYCNYLVKSYGDERMRLGRRTA